MSTKRLQSTVWPDRETIFQYLAIGNTYKSHWSQHKLGSAEARQCLFALRNEWWLPAWSLRCFLYHWGFREGFWYRGCYATSSGRAIASSGVRSPRWPLTPSRSRPGSRRRRRQTPSQSPSSRPGKRILLLVWFVVPCYLWWKNTNLRGSTTVWLTVSLFCLDSVALLMLLYSFGWIQTIQTGGQL